VTGLEFTVGTRRYAVDRAAPADLAVTLDFEGGQPRFFAPERARAEPMRAGSFSGAVRHGASCNCATLTLAPHCHGTHTECVGHLTDNGPGVAELTPVAPSLALLLTLQPERRGDFHPGPGEVAAPDDRVLRAGPLEAAAARWLDLPWTSLVIRTLPNEPAKRHRDYDAQGAAYFLPEAMRWIVGRGVTSLVVDLPSLDRADDGGRLAAHRTYWGLPAGSTDGRLATRAQALVTELAYVPDALHDGPYLLDLHVPAFASDAAPSRPVLYPLHELPGGGTAA
jgi:kynurenine formamidase